MRFNSRVCQCSSATCIVNEGLPTARELSIMESSAVDNIIYIYIYGVHMKLNFDVRSTGKRLH